MTLARRYVPAFLEARQGAAEIVPHLGPTPSATRWTRPAPRPRPESGTPCSWSPFTTAHSESPGPWRCAPSTWYAGTWAGPPGYWGQAGRGGLQRLPGGPSPRVRLQGRVIHRQDRFWPITSGRVHQILTAAAEAAGIAIPP